jgi:hypothetical protein
MNTINPSNPSEKTSNYVSYTAVNNLLPTMDDYVDGSKNINVKIYLYKIDNTSSKPFLKYLLYKNPITNVFYIPNTNVTNKATSESIIHEVEKYIQTMLNKQNYSKRSLDNIIFKGFLLEEETIQQKYDTYNEDNEDSDNDESIVSLCMFFDLSSCRWTTYDGLLKNDILWFATVDELINKRHICNFSIDNDITEFFIRNQEFLFLKDENNHDYEIPVVAYCGKHESSINFTYIFGNGCRETDTIFGNYYYFTDYVQAIREGGWSINGEHEYKYGKLITENEYGKYKRGGIIRVALFMGKNKMVENLAEDKSIDNSEIKQIRLQDEQLHKKEQLLMRITDYDGKWSKEYDSVFLPELLLDNGTKLENTPIMVVKNHEQQQPLSYHWIDKRYLQEKFDEKLQYLIM